MEQNGNSSLILTAKQSFFAGVAAGVMAVATLGYVLMLAEGGGASRWFSGGVERKPLAAAPAAVQPAPSDERAVGPVAPVTDDDHIRGDKDAPITLIEYSDVQCPFCARFHPALVQALNEYEGQVRWVYRHFPLSSIHPDAQKAAEASECANEQGKFWEMLDKMFEKQATGLSIAQLTAYAKEIGVRDMNKFDSCLSSGKYAQTVAADLQSGETAGVSSTPATIVIGKDGSKQIIPGALPYESVQQIIESMLAS